MIRLDLSRDQSRNLMTLQYYKKKANELESFIRAKKKFDAENIKKYKVKAIVNNIIYSHKAKNQLPSLYYLVSWKSYLEKKIFKSPKQ